MKKFFMDYVWPIGIIFGALPLLVLMVWSQQWLFVAPWLTIMVTAICGSVFGPQILKRGLVDTQDSSPPTVRKYLSFGPEHIRGGMHAVVTCYKCGKQEEGKLQIESIVAPGKQPSHEDWRILKNQSGGYHYTSSYYNGPSYVKQLAGEPRLFSDRYKAGDVFLYATTRDCTARQFQDRGWKQHRFRTETGDNGDNWVVKQEQWFCDECNNLIDSVTQSAQRMQNEFIMEQV